MPLPSPPLYVRGEYVIETYVCGVQLLTIEKPINRPSWWKGKFALFQMPVTTRRGVADTCPKADSPALTTSEGKGFYIQKCVLGEGGGELHAETAQSSVTVSFKLVIGGLTSVIFVVLDIVNLQFQGFPHSSVSKKSACNAGDLGSFPGSGRSPGEGNGNPLRYSSLENPWTEEPGRL